MSDLTATRDRGRPSSRLRPTVSRPEKILSGSLCGQRLERNAKPLGRGGAIREQRDIERGIVGQHSVQFGIMRGGRARHVEGGFHCGPGRGRETPAKRSVKNKVKIKINRIEHRQVSESVERFSVTFFHGLNERHNFVDCCLIENATRLPKDKRQIFAEQNVSGKFQFIRTFCYVCFRHA